MKIPRYLLGTILLVWLLARLISVPRYPLETPGAPVEILRDAVGDPHVFAADEWDLYYGQGYITAEDRMFQMDWMRRALLGRQAEVGGPEYMRSDFVSRALELKELAREFYYSLPVEERMPLEAFAAGVNAWLGRNHLPREFEILHYRPKPWRPWDILVIERGMAIRLADLSDDLKRDGSKNGDGRQTLLDLPERWRGLPDRPRLASNSWAVSPRRASGGRALLACDSHLDLTQPGPFARIALSSPGIAATGLTVPGLPGVVFGRTRGVAWGVTAFCGDTADLFRSSLHQDDDRLYRSGGEWRRIERKRPVVMLRLHRFLTVPVFWQAIEFTHLGPIVQKERDHILSLSWEGQSYGATERLITTKMVRANSRAEVEEILRLHALPDLNVVVADTSGSIARYIAARIPKRKRHPGPRSADDPELAWRGSVPFDDLPHIIDPAEGYVVSANNAPGECEHYLGWDFGHSRFDRIRLLLDSRARHSMSDMTRIQADVHVPDAEEVRERLLASLAGAELDALEREALELLESWNLKAEAESAGALIFRLFYFFGEGSSGFRRAVSWLRRTWGDDPGAWRWGDYHVVRFEHALETRSPGLSLGPHARRGDRGTVDVAWYPIPEAGWDRKSPPPRLVSTFGPAFRFVTELGGSNVMSGNLATGQSGDPDSPHYRDRLDDWLENRKKPFAGPGERPGVVSERIILEP